MARNLQPRQVMLDTSEGVIQKTSQALVPKNSVKHAINFDLHERLGNAKVRKGSKLIDTNIVGESNQINGLYYFKDSDGSESRLLAVINESGDTNQSIYYLNGSNNWTQGLSGDTPDLRTRFATFLDQVVRLNGTDPVKASSDGKNWSTSNSALDLGNFPNGKFVRVYKDQICVAGVSGNPDSVYISSVVDKSATSISWTSGDRKITVNPEDNSNITALGEVAGKLVIFKDSAMYLWNNRATNADKQVDIGCSSQESVTKFGPNSTLAFFNPSGVYATTGGSPQKLSKRVEEWIEAMDDPNYNVAAHGTENYLRVSIGDCTLNGVSYSNVVLKYSVQSQAWTVHTYPYEITAFEKDLTDNKERIAAGSDDDRVYRIDQGSDDNGESIEYELISQEHLLGSRGVISSIQDFIMAYGRNPDGMKIQVQTNGGDWHDLGSMDDTITKLDFNKAITGNYFDFRVIGVTSESDVVFEGLELPRVSVTKYGDNG